MSMNTDDVKRLQLAELHEVWGNAGIAPRRKIYEYRFQDSLLGPCVRLSFDPMREKYRKEGIQYVDLALRSGRLSLNERTWNNENDLSGDTVALLQRARAIMNGEG